MEIIYKDLATGGESRMTSLSSCYVTHTLYPSSFVADNSNFDLWSNDA
jgi:hypothetical protein